MGVFSKNDVAKARRTEERQHQQEKANAEPTPYVHSPTHALSDALLSVPHAYRATDKERLKEAHKQRLDRDAAALAAGLDSYVTKVPAAYWQGRPPPGVVQTPSRASLVASSVPDPLWKGKGVGRPVALDKRRDPVMPTDEGYASALSRKNTGESRRGEHHGASGSPGEPETNPSEQDEAIEGDEEAERKRLKRRLRALEKRRGKTKEQSLADQASIPIRSSHKDTTGSHTDIAFAQHPALPRSNVGSTIGIVTRTNSPDAKMRHSSRFPPVGVSSNNNSTWISASGETGTDTVDGNNWALHPAARHVMDQTIQEQPKALKVTGPRHPSHEVESCYASLDDMNQLDSFVATNALGYPGNRSKQPLKPSQLKMPEVKKPFEQPGINQKSRQASSSNPLAEFDFGFGPKIPSESQSMMTTPHAHNYVSEQGSQSRGAAREEARSHRGRDRHESPENLIEF